ncbi:MAG: hypothetical protein WB471_01695 [Nocardioides sp.]
MTTRSDLPRRSRTGRAGTGPGPRCGWLPGLAIGLLLGLLAPSAAQALPPGGDDPDDVFTARVERVERDPGPVGRPVRYTYTVQVEQVFGKSEISSVRVRVQTSSTFGECETRPESKGAALYLWKLTRQGDGLLAIRCRDVSRGTDTAIAAARSIYGAPRSPIESTPSEPAVEFADVGYSCPDSSQALLEVASAEQLCDEVASPLSFDRAAAPGLALVLVGILGWVVVLRVGRTRRS